jgi:predicted membrane chloride channel (bestrophin family)
MDMPSKIHKKYPLVLRVILIVGIVMFLKLIAHWFGWEIISLNPLLSGIVAANVFLMGFLLSGILTDYKESERLPGELTTSIESIVEEAVTIYKSKNAPPAKECLTYLHQFTVSVKNWFYKKERTKEIMEKLSGLSDFFVAFEPLTQATFIARLKQEQTNIRRILVRIHIVRETSFVSSGYLIAEITTVLLVLGLILSKIDPFYESLFFVGVITFLLTFLILLIRDLDNPFGYYESDSTEDVSLKPLDDLIEKLIKILKAE